MTVNMEEYFLELLDILIAKENKKCMLHPGMTTGTKVKIKDLKEKVLEDRYGKTPNNKE